MSRHPELWEAAKGGKPTCRDRQRAARQALQRLHRTPSSRLYPIVQRHRLEPVRPVDAPHPQLHEGEPGFRDSRDGYQEIHFPPLSAWMVFTDGISHSVLTGQHALVTTVLDAARELPHPELAPYQRVGAIRCVTRRTHGERSLHTESRAAHAMPDRDARGRAPSPSCSSATSSRGPPCAATCSTIRARCATTSKCSSTAATSRDRRKLTDRTQCPQRSLCFSGTFRRLIMARTIARRHA